MTKLESMTRGFERRAAWTVDVIENQILRTARRDGIELPEDWASEVARCAAHVLLNEEYFRPHRLQCQRDGSSSHDRPRMANPGSPLSEPKTTDYCVRCGESPDSAVHILPMERGHDYVDPRENGDW